MRYEDQKKYPVIEWMVDEYLVKTETLSIGAENPDDCVWSFVLSAGEPKFAIVGNRITCHVRFVLGEELNTRQVGD